MASSDDFNLTLDEFLTVGDMNNLAGNAVGYIKKYTPEDTFDLTNETKVVKKATKQDLSIIIENKSEYGVYVEEGVGANYNYYKNGGRRKGGQPFHIGKGAHMFQRALNDLEDTPLEIITK